MKLNFATQDERDHLASKQQEGYSAYMKAFIETSMNKILMPIWFIKDNMMLFVKVFLATMMFLILMSYTNDIYAEWNLGTQAGKAAYLIMKVWFSYVLFTWLFPKNIITDVHQAADRLVEVTETKAWLKKTNTDQAQSVSA